MKKKGKKKFSITNKLSILSFSRNKQKLTIKDKGKKKRNMKEKFNFKNK